MIKFEKSRTGVTLEYQAEMRGNGWVWRELKKRTGARISNGDCQDFRVRAGIMGKKESHYVPTQGAGDPG